MKTLLKIKLGIVVTGMIAFTSTLTQAQTTANGPYYATPSWDQTLPSNTRFIVLSNFTGQAVLDRETGLVWERSPSPTPLMWLDALNECSNFRVIGDRRGWRLPSVHELATLRVEGTADRLPAGHPFQNVQLAAYWSATTASANPASAWGVFFMPTSSGPVVPGFGKDDTHLVWCVRGANNTHQY